MIPKLNVWGWEEYQIAILTQNILKVFICITLFLSLKNEISCTSLEVVTAFLGKKTENCFAEISGWFFFSFFSSTFSLDFAKTVMFPRV